MYAVRRGGRSFDLDSMTLEEYIALARMLKPEEYEDLRQRYYKHIGRVVRRRT